MKWLNIIEKYLFKKDKKYMIKHIINNSNKITIDILYKIQIDKIVDNTNKLIDINQLSKKLIKIKKIIDETNNYIPLEHSIYPVESDTYKLIDLVSIKNKVIPSDYQTILIDTINIYNSVITLFNEKEMIKDDLDYEHNSKIIDLYIITMDNIIHKLFDAINK